MEVFDNEVVPSSLQQIAPILRVATEIQQDRPRVAYLCNSFSLILFSTPCFDTWSFILLDHAYMVYTKTFSQSNMSTYNYSYFFLSANYLLFIYFF